MWVGGCLWYMWVVGLFVVCGGCWFVYDMCGLVVCFGYVYVGGLFVIYVGWWFVCDICGLVVCL